MTRRLVAAALLATSLACGLKNNPVAPQLVQPRSPTNLDATSVAGGVEVTWRRPDSYSGGGRMNDLDYVVVERAPGDGGGTFTEVGRVVITDRDRFRQERRMRFTDTTAPVGSRFRYRVVAVTLDDYESAPAGPVAITVGQPAPEKPRD